MVGRRYIIPLIIGALIASLLPSPAWAEETKNKGLLVSPVRNYITTQAGESVTRAFTTANLTDKTIVVTFSIESFSVDDYEYAYLFNEVANDWVKLIETRVELKPYESREVPYRIDIPASAAPGGQYYTLFASADLSSTGLAGTVRAASLLYLTVDGELQKTSELISSHVPRVALSPQIPYTLNVKNTGNTHYFAYVSATLDGLLYHSNQSGTSQLLMPNTVRSLSQTINAPLLPGIYKLTYGYTPDDNNPVLRSSYIVFIPPWSIALLALILLSAIEIIRRRRRSNRATAHSSSQSPTDF